MERETARQPVRFGRRCGRPAMAAAESSGVKWRTVELRSHAFHRSVAAAILSQGASRSEDFLLELAPFHDHIYATQCHRWLDIHGTHRNRGCEKVLSLGSRLFPGVPLLWILGEKFNANPGTPSLPGQLHIRSCHTMVNIPWLTAYLLLVTVEGKAIKNRDPAARATELLQLMASLPSSELNTPCAGGSLRISARGVSASMDDDAPFLSAMADACQAAECQSPIPGPLDKVTTWVRLTELGWKMLEQRVFRPEQQHVLQVVQEWSVLLLAWLCVGVYERCVGQVEPSTHALLATQAPGRCGAGPLLRSRLSVKRNIRGARREWKQMVRSVRQDLIQCCGKRAPHT